jgi:hypothetical protein
MAAAESLDAGQQAGEETKHGAEHLEPWKWTKGCKSPNPSGRAKGTGAIARLARQYCPEAIYTTVAIMRHPKTPPATRLAACNSIMDRGLGRPQSSVEIRHTKGASEYTTAELEAIIREEMATTCPETDAALDATEERG